MHLVHREADTLRAREFIALALDTNRRPIVPKISIKINDKERMYRNRHGWRRGLIVSLNAATIMIDFEG